MAIQVRMWGDGEIALKKTLFGDTFGMRTDYTAGTFYRGRMQYLLNDEGDPPNYLEPPPIYKTKSQARNALRVKELSFQKLNFPKKDGEGENGPTIKSQSKKILEGAKKQTQKKQQQLQPVVHLKSVAEIVKEDWGEEYQAGCKMWVNHNTGEVCADCPWSSEDKLTSPAVVAADDEGGTGALVYDGG